MCLKSKKTKLLEDLHNCAQSNDFCVFTFAERTVNLVSITFQQELMFKTHKIIKLIKRLPNFALMKVDI